MRIKKIIAAILIVAQPIIWWYIYILLYPLAIKTNSEKGTGMAITMACLGSIIFMVVAAFGKQIKETITNKDESNQATD